MKKLTYLLIALILLGSGVFSSCDKVKDLLEITLKDVEFKAEIKGSDLFTKADLIPFAGTVTINPIENDELAPYLETIRRVEVTEVKITVDAILPESGVILNDAIFSFTDAVNGEDFSYPTPEPIPLALGTEIHIGGEMPDYSVISNIISALHAANIGVTGNLNQPGLPDLTFTIKADITVGVPQD